MATFNIIHCSVKVKTHAGPPFGPILSKLPPDAGQLEDGRDGIKIHGIYGDPNELYPSKDPKQNKKLWEELGIYQTPESKALKQWIKKLPVAHHMMLWIPNSDEPTLSKWEKLRWNILCLI